MSANLQKSPKVVAISPGPLEASGFTLTPTGLVIDPSVTYEEWEVYGRRLAIAERGIQWAIGDWIRHGEKAYGDKYTQAIELCGLKRQTLANYAFVAGAIETYRRRDIVDFSTHAEVASLPVAEQEKILSRAAKEDTPRHSVRKEVRRVKKRLKLIPDEVEILHTEEVQNFLDGYVEVLKGLDEHVPAAAMFLHGMIESHIGQAQWQKDRTIESDYGAILDTFDEAYTQTDQHIFKHLMSSGHFISDPDLDDRLETMARHSILVAAAQEAKTKHVCECRPEHKQLTRVPPGGKQDTRRGDMGPDLYMLFDQPTGDSATVNRAQSRYDSGERA